jgi:hypothetical protein
LRYAGWVVSSDDRTDEVRGTQDKVGTARTRMDEEIRYAVVSLGSFLAGERAEIVSTA